MSALYKKISILIRITKSTIQLLVKSFSKSTVKIIRSLPTLIIKIKKFNTSSVKDRLNKTAIKSLFKNLKSKKLLKFSLPIATSIILVIGVLTYLTKPVEAAWWDPTWQYRKKLSVSNSGTLVTDFQVELSLDTTSLISSGKMKDDCGDIRVTDSSGNLQSHWIETCNSASSSIWVKVSLVPNPGTTLYVYYGNPSASDTSSADNVFIFFDGFDGDAVDTNKWTVVDGTGITVGNGFLRATSTTGWLESKTTFNKSTEPVIEAKIQHTTMPSNGYSPISFWASTSDGWGGLIHPTFSLYRWTNGSYTSIYNSTAVPDIQVQLIAHSSTADIYYYNSDTGATVVSSTGITNSVDDEPIRFIRRMDNTYTGQAMDASWDWIRARKYSATTSVGSTGAEEKSPGKPIAKWLFDEGYSKSDVYPILANEQQINIINQTFSTTSTSNVPTDNSLGIIKWDAGKYSDAHVYFETLANVGWSNGCGNAGHVALVDTATGTEVTNSSLCFLSTTYSLSRSPEIFLEDGHEYTVRIKHNSTNSVTVKLGRLIILQSNATAITDTETQIEVGAAESQDSSTATELTNEKIYKYDASKFYPTPTAYFEATLRGGSQPTIEQQINILDQTYYTTSTSYVPTDGSLGIIKWDGTKYAGDTVYLEAIVSDPWSNGCGHATWVQLWDMTAESESTAMCFLWNGYTWQRSAEITNLVDGHEYTIRIKDQDSNNTSIKAARLIIQQTDTQKITDTQTQIEIGNSETKTSSTPAPLNGEKIYEYDASKFSPTPTAYFEATFRGGSNPTIEQQITILNQVYSTSSTSYVPDDGSLGVIKWDAAKYSGATVYFEAVATDPWSNGCNHATHVQLWDMTASAEVTNLCFLVNGWTWQRSADITSSLTDGNEYTVRVLDQDSNTLSIRAARLIIQQTDTQKITDTQTSIDLGNYESTDSSTYTDLSGQKIYEYDESKFSPTPTAYFEASLPESAQGPTIEQQIPIVTQRYQETGSTYSPVDNSLGIIHWDSAKYTGATTYFEAVMKKVANCWGGGGDAYAELYDITADAAVSNSEIHTTSTSWYTVRSSDITLVDGNDYTVHLKNTGCVNESFIFLQTARLIIQQTDSTKIQDTQTRIDLGTAEATNSSSMTTQTNQKIYYYDSSKFSPTPTPYFEATFRPDSPIIEQQINIVDQVYTWPGSGWQPSDNSLGWVYWDSSNYSGLLAVYAEYDVNATSGLFGSTEKMALFDETNTIVGVSEIDTAGFSKGYTRYRTADIKSALTDGYKYTVRLNHTNSGITIRAARLIILQSDGTKITDTSTQIEVGDYQTGFTNTSATLLTNPKIYQYDADKFSPTVESSGDASFAATLKIADASDTVYAALYNKTHDTLVATVSHTGDTNVTYVVASDIDSDSDWDTTNNDEYYVKVYCADGGSDGCIGTISNAKIILDQNPTAGVTDLETIQLENSTLTTRAATTYANSASVVGYENIFAQANIGVKPTMYYEATMKTSAGTGYAILYDRNNGRYVTNSEINTTSTSYSRIRSSYSIDPDFYSLNDAHLKTDNASYTVSVSNVQLVLQISGLPTSGPTSDSVVELFQVGGSTVTNSGLSNADIDFNRIISSALTLTSGEEYVVRYKNATLLNANIVLEQSDSGGITDLEIIQEQIDHPDYNNSTSYSTRGYPQRFNPNLETTQISFLGGSLSYYFESVMKTSSGSGTAYALLYDSTNSAAISGSEIYTTSTNFARVRTSSPITNNMPQTMPARKMDAQTKNTSTSYETNAVSSRLIIQVHYLSTTGAPYTTAELYDLTTTTSVSSSQLTPSASGFHLYRSGAITLTDGDKYVVRFKSSNEGVPTYIANARIILVQSDAGGITDLETMQQQVNTPNAISGAYSSRRYDNRFNPGLTTTQIAFAGGVFNYFYEATMKTSSGSGYAQLYNLSNSSAISGSQLYTTSSSYELVRSGDITSAMPAFPQTDYKLMDTQLGSTGTATASSSWLVVQVTNLITDGLGEAYVDLYDLDATAQVSGSLLTNDTNDWDYMRTASPITLTSGHRYVARLYSSLEGGSVFIANAKIILDQSDSGGITALETMQQQVNMINSTTSDYNSRYYYQRFNPGLESSMISFAGGTFNYFYEATMKTSAGTGYARLYNNTNGSAISGSELYTTGSSYDLVRSGDITANLPQFPQYSAKQFDTQIKNTGDTTSVSNSWFIVQVSDLITDGSGTAYADLYDITSDQQVSNSLLTSTSNSWGLVRSASPITLTSGHEYVVRMRSSVEGSIVYLSTAKIILDQSDSSGIGAVETVQQYLNKIYTTSGSSYTTVTYDSTYDPDHFAPKSPVYFEATMKSSEVSGSAYSILKYDSSTEVPESEIYVTGNSYSRVRTSDPVTDYIPSTSKNYDTRVKTGGSGTAYISNSWLIVQNTQVIPDITHDNSGNALHGSVVGPTWKSGSECVMGTCLSYDGVDDYVKVNDSDYLDFAPGDSFTITAWFKHPISSGTDVLLSKYRSSTGSDGGYKIYMNLDGTITAGIDDDSSWGPDYSVTSSSRYDDNTWHHLEFIKADSSKLELYIDAELVDTTTDISTIGTLANTDNYTMGLDGDGTNGWAGLIDIMTIYNYARNANEVKIDYNTGAALRTQSSSPPEISDGLAAYWKMDDTATSSCGDYKSRPIDVTNSSASVLTNYQVRMDITYDSDMRTDFADLRFVDDSSNPLDYYLESKTDGVSAVVWVKVSSIPASSYTTIYMLYGNSDTFSMSSAADTFNPGIFFETGTESNNLDNHTEADSTRQNSAPSSTSYLNSIQDSEIPGSTFKRYRFLFIPNSSGTYNFGSNTDDGGEFTIFPGDGYGGGYNTTHPFGDHTVVATSYGGHGAGTCGSTFSPGSASLSSGQGYWLDFIMTNGGGTGFTEGCIRNPGGSYQAVSTSNFSGQIYSRSYTSGSEPTTSIGSETSAGMLICDSSGDRNSAILTGDATSTIGKINGAISFDGSSDQAVASATYNIPTSNGWYNRKKITFDNSSASEDLNNFPVLIKLNSSRIDYSKIQNSGQDIRFYDSDETTALPYEIERWNRWGDSYIWVKVPNIPSGSTTDYIWMLYNNPEASDAQNGTAVWDDNYIFVAHLNDAGTTSIKDSTGKNTNITKLGAAQPSDLPNGVVDQAQNFDGSNDYIQIPDNDVLDVTTGLTISTWHYSRDTTSDWDKVVDKPWTSDASPWFTYGLQRTSNARTYSINLGMTDSTGRGVTSTATLALNTWGYLTGTYDGQYSKFYINDGTPAVSDAGSVKSIQNTGQPIRIGGNYYNREYVYGYYDEMRISNIARSADWIAAEYKTMVDTFVSTYGTEESNDNSNATMLPMSISAWVNAATLDSSQRIIIARGSSPGFRWYVGTSATDVGKIIYSMNGGVDTETSSTTLSTDTWYLITVVNDGTKVSLYVNGIYDSQIDFSSGVLTGLSDISIGASADGTQGWAGKLDDIRIYNRALDSREINLLYNWMPGPIGYWKMDENTGTIASDSSGNVNNGAITAGSGKWVPGKFGTAFSFDGSNTLINAQSGDTLDNLYTYGMTLNAWIFPKSDGENNAGVIMAKNTGASANAGWILQLNSGNVLSFTVDGSSDLTVTTYESVVTLDTWNYVSLVWGGDITDDTTVHFYVNGTEVDIDTSGFGSSIVDDNSSNFYIGNDSTAASTFDGYIDEAKVYNYVRTLTNVTEDMNAGHPIPGSPVGSPYIHYKLDEGYGDTIHNTGNSGSTNDGSLAGATSCPGDSACPAWSNDGKFGKALSFDGSNDYADMGSETLWKSTEPRTVSFWTNLDGYSVEPYPVIFIMKSDKTEGFRMFYSDESGYEGINFGDSGDYYLKRKTVGDISTSLVGSWINVTLVYDGISPTAASSYKLFIDGSLQPTMDVSGGVSSVSQNNQLGANAPGGYYFDGLIDEFQLFNAALTDYQINTLYNQGKAMVIGSTGTDASGNGNNSVTRTYCPPGDNTGRCAAGQNPAPIAEWNLDENTGTVAHDTSGSAYDLSFTGMTGEQSWVPGKQGSAIYIDGVDDCLLKNSSPYPHPDTISISAWIYLNSTPEVNHAVIVTYGDNYYGDYPYRFYVDSNNALNFLYGDGGTSNDIYSTSSGAISPGAWYYVAVNETYGTSSSAQFFINGQKVAGSWTNGDGTRAKFTSTFAKLSIGAIYRSTEDCSHYPGFPGDIDTVRIYDYARTPAQIAWEYNRGGPIANYKFDECSGSFANNSAVTPNGMPIINEATIAIVDGGSAVKTTGTCSSLDTSESWSMGAIGKYNASVGLDGTNDYITAEDAPAIEFNSATQDFTLSTWIKRGYPIPDPNTGGVVTQADGYYIHTFYESGTFTVNEAKTAQVLVVAGGGGGGDRVAGGGGAGGVIYDSSFSITPQAYSVTVGGGGTGATDSASNGANGGNSVFDTMTAVGGGGGGGYNTRNGSGGGSGGGASGYSGTGGSGTSGQGYAGGNYVSNYGAAGGGGASEVGANGSSGGTSIGGDGGDGVAYSISGKLTYYGGGGGGSGYQYTTAAAGGLGGGGVGGLRGTSPGSGLSGTGGGGGGRERYGSGGDGGSGIVIIRYPIEYEEISDQTEYLFSKEDADNDGYRLMINSDNTITCSINSTDITSTVTVDDTNWHQIGCTIDRTGTGQVYIDGLPSGSAVSTSSITMSTGADLYFGARSYSTTFYFSGQIDEIRVYNYALTNVQMKNLFNNGNAAAFSL